MKNIFWLFCLVVLPNTIFAQEEKEQKIEIRKEVEVEEINGTKRVTIKTEKNGLSSVEVLEGEKAEAFLAEGMERAVEEEVIEADPNKERKEIRMTDNNGVKFLTIKTYKGGEITEEVFEGEAAENKLKEIESQPKEGSKKVMIKSNQDTQQKINQNN